jgi:TPR repeat protein
LRRKTILVVLSLLANGCSAGSYAGIDLRPGHAVDEDVRTLALRAKAGDKNAQLVLGDLFVVGQHVPRDTTRARALYSAAAQKSGGTLWIYSPPVGKEKAGRVIPVTQPVVPGLAAAAARLAALDAGGTPEN